MSLKIQTKKIIRSQDWDAHVTKVYGKPYCFQQTGGCLGRGTYGLTVPAEDSYDYELESLTFDEYGESNDMGVSFAAWLARDPKKPFDGYLEDDWATELIWHRNFYPDIEILANDLYDRGELPAGEYTIVVDW